MSTKTKKRITKAERLQKECLDSLEAQRAHSLEMIALAEKMPGDNPMQRAFRWQWLRTK